MGMACALLFCDRRGVVPIIRDLREHPNRVLVAHDQNIFSFEVPLGLLEKTPNTRADIGQRFGVGLDALRKLIFSVRKYIAIIGARAARPRTKINLAKPLVDTHRRAGRLGDYLTRLVCAREVGRKDEVDFFRSQQFCRRRDLLAALFREMKIMVAGIDDIERDVLGFAVADGPIIIFRAAGEMVQSFKTPDDLSVVALFALPDR